MSHFLWKIGGQAGFGVMTTGLSFSKIATKVGYYIFDCFEYPSLIRGGHNTYDVILSSDPVHAIQHEINLLVCLNKETFELHKHRLTKDSIVIYDENSFTPSENNCKMIHLPFKTMLFENKASMVMENNIALGCSLAILNWPYQVLDEMIEQTFADKGASVVALNKKISKLAYDFIVKNHSSFIIHDFPILKKSEPKVVLTGNDAFAYAAIAADCRLYAAYPMTPSSTVLTTLAANAQKTGMVVRHAEDEISVINTALGASTAGVRAACGSSGGGFALMVESVSFAGIAEIPLVIFMSQRPGPATGLPSWTEQGDLLFTVHAGHGEFPKIVLAPGDPYEMYALTVKAFDLADYYQTPVIVLSDKHLSESNMSINHLDLKLLNRAYSPDSGKLIWKANHYQRYADVPDGISPRLVPGYPGQFYQVNSYEHTVDSHTTEDAQERVIQVNKRNRKTQTYLAKHFAMPEIFGDINKSEIVFVSWGSNKGAILEAQKKLTHKGFKTAFIHFTHVFPLNESRIAALLTLKKRYILIENNSQGQFGKLLREQTGVNLKVKILKYSGRQIHVEEIVNYVNAPSFATKRSNVISNEVRNLR